MYIKFLLFIGVSSLTFAQIGINKTTINANSVFETSATNQGILIPRIPVVKNLTDKSFLNLPAETLPDGLLIYCEGGSGSIGSGYYFWQNNQWNYILDLKNLQNRIDITRLYTTTTTGNTPGIVKDFYKNLSKGGNSFENIPQLDYNNSLSVARWTVIPETEVDFQIEQADNTITLTTYGNAQTGSNSYINTVTPYSSRTLTFNIGIFIKAKGANDSAYRLYAIGSFANSTRRACLVTPFTVSTVINLSQAGNYTAKVFALGRRNFITRADVNNRADYYYPLNESNTTYGNAGNYTYLTVGGKSSGSGNQGENNGSCTNTDKLTMGTTLNILVSEVTPKN
ncbi:hypothetical protein [Empedobacter brevis]|uniref:hypothetical protein n=1 Tax=Empedobacter brevis TaxID=247 RepID=UPI002899E6DE|nr:hypothetical protein [Empedobacter brevis]